MKKKRQPARPAGTIRNAQVTQTADGMPVLLPHAIFSFPADKEAAEEIAMDGLASQLSHGYVPYSFQGWNRHSKQDGPDFDVIWNGSAAYVEATELAPLTGPYETAHRVFTVGEMSKILELLVLKKNAKYKDRGYTPVFLLLYVTDDAFYVAEEVLLVLAHRLQVGPQPIFEAVFFVSFWANGEAHMRMPFPHKDNLLLLNVDRFREQQVINPDITKYRVIEKNPATNSVTMRQYLPPGCDISMLVDSIKRQLPGLDQALASRGAQQGAPADPPAAPRLPGG